MFLPWSCHRIFWINKTLSCFHNLQITLYFNIFNIKYDYYCNPPRRRWVAKFVRRRAEQAVREGAVRVVVCVEVSGYRLQHHACVGGNLKKTNGCKRSEMNPLYTHRVAIYSVHTSVFIYSLLCVSSTCISSIYCCCATSITYIHHRSITFFKNGLNEKNLEKFSDKKY